MEIELENLYKWVDEIPLSRSKRNIARDFSDGVLMAEILKYFYPRLVDIHNYPPTNSLARKVTNWTTLNIKVLQKCGLQLNKRKIERIARSTEGAIENLLQALFRKVKAEQEKKLLREQQERNLEQNVYIVQKKGQSIPVSGIPVTADFDNESRVILVTEKMMPVSEMEQKLKELAGKEETISALSLRVSHYEQLLKLKDQRIKDLLQQIQLISGGAPSGETDHAFTDSTRGKNQL